ncbi:hypothetical protein LCGC14_0673800 [marine sediment metagenome]|uniref:Uncharacterized protein n=1 Tax=marine sediment metagenome TaxID=412755 RepID=A0A0F9RAK7_9ZZZZ
MNIRTESGRKYNLTDDAILWLLDSTDARSAESVFEGFASHVPVKDRLAVWVAVEAKQ